MTADEVAAKATAAVAAATARQRWETLLAPDFDRELKSHAYVASFGNAARIPGKEPGFEVLCRQRPTHARGSTEE
eukprot:2162642-Prymnesium_polylepis.2